MNNTLRFICFAAAVVVFLYAALIVRRKAPRPDGVLAKIDAVALGLALFALPFAWDVAVTLD